MGWGKLGAAFCVAHVMCLTVWAGLCKPVPGSAGFPKVVCYFPSCPTGTDCIPPTIDVASAKVEYTEPFLRWQSACPDRNIMGSCWEVLVSAKFKLKANDPSGVTAVGFHIKQWVDNRETIVKFWSDDGKEVDKGKAEPPPTNPDEPPSPPLPGGGNPPPPVAEGGSVIELSRDTRAYVPPGQRLELSVAELCAKDGRENIGCIPAIIPILEGPPSQR